MKKPVKKINLSEPMKNLDGTNMFEENHSCGFIFSNYLTQISTNNPTVTIKIAKDLLKDEELELLVDEVEFLKTIVLESNMKDIMKFRLAALLE